jgi:tetratricopeptide (TPR) repeat protein
MGYHRQRPGIRAVDGASMGFFEEALETVPEDGKALLAIGSMYEASGRVGKNRDQLEKAEKYYRRALAGNPQLTEARLRLGAVLLALGQDKRAHEDLKWTLSHSRDPYFFYLTHILLGDILRHKRRWVDAVASYRTALELEPQSQVACNSLSHALHRSGDRKRAREVMEGCLGLPVDSPDYEDGWWRYHLGQSHRFETLIEQWREKVMQ